MAGPTAFAPFTFNTDYLVADRLWMIKLRVDGLDALTASLGAAGIEVVTKPEWDAMPEVGCLARIHDPEGDPIELWQLATPA